MKYHICREKMQLSRAKPGNPASIYIYIGPTVHDCDDLVVVALIALTYPGHLNVMVL